MTTPATPATIDPLIVHWDREVIWDDDRTADTIVCCLAEDGHPVALMVTPELLEVLGSMLLDPPWADEDDSMAGFEP